MDIRIEDLFYIYESNSEPVVALRGLQLSVASGECLVIKGPNGSGKSTLVKLLTGFATASAGRILIGEEDISRIDPLRLRREYISSIDQRGNLLRDITILDNIALAFALVGHTRTRSRQLASDLLSAHGLSRLAERYQDQLSSGERQFASLLAAIATNPKVLIADEPSGELDNSSAEVMYSLLKSLAGSASVILVTHDVRAEQYADRIVRLRDGRISEEWLPGGEEKSVIDSFGWMRTRERDSAVPKRLTQTSRENQQPLLGAINVSLSYAGKDIFSMINLTGSSGEFIALSSTSGSGKSSLLRILCGLQNPTFGEVYVMGQSLKGLSREERANLRRDSVGFLGQGGSALSNISVLDHLGPLQTNLADSFGERLSQPLSSFSGGERARIELVKILAEGKPILLLDEPTSQMDERRSLDAAQMILDYVGQGGLVIASTRDEALLDNADFLIAPSI